MVDLTSEERKYLEDKYKKMGLKRSEINAKIRFLQNVTIETSSNLTIQKI